MTDISCGPVEAAAPLADPRVRPLEPADAAEAAAVIRAAFQAAAQARGEARPGPSAAKAARLEGVIARLAEVDRGGCYVAERDDGAVAGVAVSIRRGALWGLSLLGVHPEHQSAGVGRQLLEAALGHAEGARVRMIQSSDDPRAVRRYAGAGLAIHPAMAAEGTVPAGLIPPGLPPTQVGGPEHLHVVDAVDTPLRGSSRRSDVAHALATGAELLLDPDGGGFAVQDDSRPLMIGARDEATAARLLWQCFARATGPVTLRGLTASQGWALRLCLDARLPLTPSGPMCVAGMERLPGPYYPSGIYF